MVKRIAIILTVAFVSLAVADQQCDNQKVQRRERNIYSPIQRLFDQDFGLALTPEDFLTSMNSFMSPFSMFRDYYRPWRHVAALSKDVGSTIIAKKDKFQINLDVQHFAPDELSVKTADGYIVIEAKHEEKKDEHGFVSRQFSRRYSLPEGVNPEAVVSQLSSDGVLTVTAPRKEVEKIGERVVPISQTGPVRKQASKEVTDETCENDVCVSNE